MARLRGRPLNEISPGEMEAIEERVERAALNRHLSEQEDAEAAAEDRAHRRKGHW